MIFNHSRCLFLCPFEHHICGGLHNNVLTRMDSPLRLDRSPHTVTSANTKASSFSSHHVLACLVLLFERKEDQPCKSYENINYSKAIYLNTVTSDIQPTTHQVDIAWLLGKYFLNILVFWT